MTRPRYWKGSYNAYMNSLQWQEKRQWILIRADGRCERCNKACKRLQVHHLHYRNFTQERDDDLLAVCETCHKKLDADRRKEVRHQRLVKRVTVWMDRVEGCGWQEKVSFDAAVIRFRRWLHRKKG